MEIPKHPHAALRQEARKKLGDMGVMSNPGWMDHDIVSALRSRLNLDPVARWGDEWREDEFEVYRSQLIDILTSAGVELKEPITEMQIIQGIDRLPNLTGGK